MTNEEELNHQIQVILDKELDDLLNWIPSWDIKEEKGKHILRYPNADTLIDVFSNIQNNPYLKIKYKNSLCDEIENSGEKIETRIKNYGPTLDLNTYYYNYISTSSISFYALLRLGFTKEAISSFKKRISDSGSIILIIDGLLKEDFSYFDKQNLDELLKKLKECKLKGSANKVNNAVISKIIKERYELLKKEIKGINLEINQDKKTITEKISYLDFDVKYNELLNEIDKFINTKTSSIVNAGMVSNLRTFLEDLFTDVSKKISKIKNESIPKIKGCGEMGNIRNYLKIQLELSDKDNKFINSFIDILHSEGGHSFTTKKEYFRLSRNIAIEIALLILSKYEQHYNPT